MPLSSIEAAVAALIVAVGNAFVALEVIGNDQATRLESTIVGVLAAAFVLGNAIVHHAVTTATGKDASE